MGARARAAAPARDLAPRRRPRQGADPAPLPRGRSHRGPPEGVSVPALAAESPLAPPDAALVLAARDGDQAALAALIARHAAGIAQLCRRLVGPNLCDDCAQDTLLLATLRLPRLRDADAFAA